MIPAAVDTAAGWVVLAAYFGVWALLTAYGAHRAWLLWVLWRYRHRDPVPAARWDLLPTLTVQLPLYNEMYVARRVIDAACAIDYPRDRLQIQVLDDSTDETTAIAREAAAAWRSRGVDIVHLHRAERTGFKAGALSAGLESATGDLVAVFDADFVPPSDFARKIVDFFTDPRVGMVQARWGHLNRLHSALTRVQSILLDGHFLVEHQARHRSGCFFNFNGTAGIWRRSCIEDAGGWQHDTLTEDLDLSYRAQMRGWRFVFLSREVSPAELPVEMSAFKSQQHRWAKGSIQTARKLLPRILRSRLPLRVRAEAVLHLTANLGYPLSVALALLAVPSVWVRRDVAARWLLIVDLPLFLLTTVSVACFYLASQREALGSWRRALLWIPVVMAVGIGLSVNNTRAVLEAVLGRASPFQRTPKYNLARGESIGSRRYRGSVTADTWFELALASYFAVGIVTAASEGLWGSLPLLALFGAGFAYTAGLTLVQGRGTG